MAVLDLGLTACGLAKTMASFRARERILLRAALLCLLLPLAASAQSSYLLFESGPVRPIAISPDAGRLFVTNTPDGQLEIFGVDDMGALTHEASVPVGLEPVAVAARGEDEVWVVNHLSDSVSIVDVSGTPRVVRTLLVGDEPSDIVFAGPGGNRAFVTTAHRGQNAPDADGSFATPSLGRADVYVFDGTNLGDSLEGDRLTVITLFGDKPRALARNAAGDRVYAAVFRSGNRTTILNELHVCDTSTTNVDAETVEGSCSVGLGGNSEIAPGGRPTPHKDRAGVAAPEAGLVVKQDRDGGSTGQWLDELDRDWSALVKFDLPDQDVFTIDASADPPSEIGTPFSGVGTTLFNMAVHSSGRIFVSNTDSQNHVRFEGPGDHVSDNGLKPAGEPATLRGNLAHSRVTVIDPAATSVSPRHLNKHIPYEAAPMPAGVAEKSLATPLGLDFSEDGDTLYVAGFGSAKVGVYDRAALEADSFTVSASDHISIGGGGPSGLLVAGSKLYVTTRWDNSLRVIDLGTKLELQRLALHNPESHPAHRDIVEGRPFLYDALLTGSNGEASCASCHIFGDMDDLGWDLGNPDDGEVPNCNPFNPVTPFQPCSTTFHSMKGPMTTQSLRGLANMGPQHWRGDRQGDEVAAFEAFNVAFPGLVGRDAGALTGQQMTDFREFALLLRYPPNPIRELDNSLRTGSPSEDNGAILYGAKNPPGPTTDSLTDCEGCHTVDGASGHFGGNGESTFDALTQLFKVPQLRNIYQKVGMFGFQDVGQTDGPFGHQGPQIRGFGYAHDGSFDTIDRFTSASVFSLSASEQRDLEAFLMVFPSDLAPIVGQQITLTPALVAGADAAEFDARFDLLRDRSAAPFTSQVLGGSVTEAEVVVHAVESAGTTRAGYLRLPSGMFQPDDGSAAIDESVLLDKVTSQGAELTFTAVPPGTGVRMALDRDEDALHNRLDNCPGAPNAAGLGTCVLGDVDLLGTPCEAHAACGGGGSCSMAQEDTDGDGTGDACEPQLLPEPGLALQLGLGLGLLLGLHASRGRASRRVFGTPWARL